MSITKLLLAITLVIMTAALQKNAYAQRERNHWQGVAADLCSSEDPKVTVRLKTAKTKYIKNYNAKTINQIHKNAGQGTILGLAGGPISIEMNGQYEIRTSNRKSCVQLSNVDVMFWAKPVIVIASNFPKGSCEYRAVLAHEQKHIRTTRKFIREFAPKLRREVHDIIDNSRDHMVVSTESLQYAQKQIQEPIIKRLIAYQNEIMPILQNRQNAIDTPEEYERVAAQCDNWGKKLTNGG